MTRPPFVPAYRAILAGLALDELDPDTERTLVDTGFLRFLIGEFARQFPFDPAFYAAPPGADATNPREHFLAEGYPNGLLPCMPAFDPAYYLRRNPDLTGVFADGGEAGLLAHFLVDGWREGRTAHPAAEADAARWWRAVEATPYRLATRTIRNAHVQAFLPPLIAGPPLGFRGGLVLGQSASDRRLRHRRGSEAVDSFPPRDGAPMRLRGEYVYGGPYCDHFGHAMAEMIHRILPARAAFPCRRLLFVGIGQAGPARARFDALPAIMQAPLRLLGVAESEVTVIHRDCVVETLHVAQQGATLLGGPSAPYLKMLQAVIPACLGVAPGEGRLYVSRSRIRGGGILLGEAYLEQCLAAESWQVLHPQDHSLLAQMQAYQAAGTIIFAEGSAVHGAELLPRLGRCLLLPRRNTEAWWVEASLRPRASALDILPRGRALGTILLDTRTGAPIEHCGVTLIDLPATAAALRGLGLARLDGIDMAAFRATARDDLAGYLACHGAEGPGLPGTKRIAARALRAFERACHEAIG